ncbi:MAG: hypothetical protein V4590_12125 [Bacteroidota bacterium]
MKQQLLCMLTILLAACGQQSQSGGSASPEHKANVNDSLQAFSITTATADNFLKAKKTYTDQTLYDTATYKKVNGAIRLPVDEKWRPFVLFTDTLLHTDNSNIREYYYVGQFDKIGFYIVGGSFWEHSEYYLIDKRTGKQTITWSSPTISPNGKFIANLSMMYGLEGVPNGIQVWRVDRQENNQLEPVSLSKYVEIDQQIWAPDDFVWETDHSVVLRVAGVDKYMNEDGQPAETDFYYLRLKLQ